MRANHADVIALQMAIAAATPDDIDADVIDLLHASPSCTHHSRAKGGRPRSNQLRSQPNEIWKFVDNKHVRRITIENVPEFVKWGPLTVDGRPDKRREGSCFNAWLTQFTARGYSYDWRILNCADYGDATSRKRFFLQAVKHGCGRIRWPEAQYAEKPETDLWGRQPLRWRGVRECLDLADTGKSIFNRSRPLAQNTLRRILVGLKKYNGLDFQMDFLGADRGDESRVRALTDPLPPQHAGGNRSAVVRPFVVKLRNNETVESIDEPLSAITTSGAHHMLCQPLVIDHFKNGEAQSVEQPIGAQTTHDRWSLVTPYLITEQANNAPRGIDKPLRAQTTVRKDYLCTPLVLGQQGGAECRPIDDPCPTIATSGAIRVITPMVLDMSHLGDTKDERRVTGGDEPIHTLTTRNNSAVVTPLVLGRVACASCRPADKPMPTLTTGGAMRGIFPVLEDGRIIDIRIRMLKPSELAAAHSFPKGYVLSGNRGEQVKQIGNSVPVQTAKAIVKAMFESSVA
jgi:DNA (cytosine-5)-methyltransferase 1